MVEDTYKKNKDDEIQLIDLFAVLWRRKAMIIMLTMLAAVGIVIFSVISLVLPPETSPLPNRFTPIAFMLIDEQASMGGALSSMMGRISIPGVKVPTGPRNSGLAIFLLETSSFLDSVVDEFDLITLYKKEKYPRATSRKKLKKMIEAEYDDKSGVLSISVTSKDPVFARDVVNYCVAYLEKRFDELGLDRNKIEKENLEVNIENTNQEILELEEESRKLEQSVAFATFSSGYPAITRDINRIGLELAAKRQIHTQLKVQYEMLKVNMSSEKPVFQILELAEVPELKSGPGRGMLCIIVTLAAGFFSVFLAFALNVVSNIRKDPHAMAKLGGTNEK